MAEKRLNPLLIGGVLLAALLLPVFSPDPPGS